MAGTLMKQSEITLAHDPFASDSQPELLHAEVESGLTQTAPTPPPHTHTKVRPLFYLESDPRDQFDHMSTRDK